MDLVDIAVVWAKKKVDQFSTWIGLVGLILLMLGFHTLLALVFIALILVPDTQFSSWVKMGSDAVKKNL